MAVSRINEAGLNVNQYGNRNLIINGAMEVAQRGTSATSVTASGYRTCDRWLFGPTSGTYTVTQESSASTADGFTNSFKIETTATGSSSNVTVQQRIEGQNLQHLGYGTSSAKQTTVSFYVKSNKTGTYTLELYSADTTRQISKNYTIDASGTWERKTITFPGDTSNGFDNDNNLSMYLFWWLAAPSGFSSGTQNTSAWASATTANRVSSSIVDISDTVGNYWEITGVQWEVGDTATDFEHRTFDDELQRCFRYFESKAFHTFIGVGYSNITTGAHVVFPYLEKRAAPTVTLPTSGQGSGQVSFLQSNGSYPSTTGSNSVYNATINQCRIQGASYVGLTEASVSAFYVNGDGDVSIDAEL